MKTSEIDGFNPDAWSTPDTYDSVFRPLPKDSGVYVFTRTRIDMIDHTVSYAVAYVGMTKNLEDRLANHEIFKEICNDAEGLERRSGLIWSVTRFFLVYPVEDLRSIERDLIQRFNPPYNTVHKRRGITA